MSSKRKNRPHSVNTDTVTDVPAVENEQTVSVTGAPAAPLAAETVPEGTAASEEAAVAPEAAAELPDTKSENPESAAPVNAPDESPDCDTPDESPSAATEDGDTEGDTPADGDSDNGDEQPMDKNELKKTIIYGSILVALFGIGVCVATFKGIPHLFGGKEESTTPVTYDYESILNEYYDTTEAPDNTETLPENSRFCDYTLNDASYFYAASDDKLTVICNGKVLATLQLESSELTYTAPTGDAVIAQPDSIVYISKEEVKTFALTNGISDLLMLSDDASAIIYTSSSGELIRISTADGAESIIDSNVISAVPSPNGCVLLYEKEAEDSETSALYLYSDKKCEKLADGLTPKAVSDDGRVSWAISDKTLYRFDRSVINKLSDDCDGVQFNADRTEAVYLEDGYYRIHTADGTNMPIIANEGSEMLMPLFPDHCENVIEHFAGRVYFNGDNYFFLCTDHSADKWTVGDVSDAKLSHDASYFCFISDGTLYRDGTDNEIASGVADAVIAYGDEIWYLTEAGELYRQSSEEAVAANVHSFDITANGKAFFIADYNEKKGVGTLYVADGDNVSAIAEKVSGFDVGAGMITYVREGEVYASTDGAAFYLMATETDIYSEHIGDVADKLEEHKSWWDFIPGI